MMPRYYSDVSILSVICRPINDLALATRYDLSMVNAWGRRESAERYSFTIDTAWNGFMFLKSENLGPILWEMSFFACNL